MKKINEMILRLRQSSKKVKIGIVLGLSLFVLVGGTGIYALTQNNSDSDKPVTTTKSETKTKKSSDTSEDKKTDKKETSKDKEEDKDADKQNTSSNDDKNTTDKDGTDNNSATPSESTQGTDNTSNNQSSGTTGTGTTTQGSDTQGGGNTTPTPTPTPTPQPQPEPEKPVCTDTLGNSGMRFNTQQEAINYGEALLDKDFLDDGSVNPWWGYEALSLQCGGWTVNFY